MKKIIIKKLKHYIRGFTLIELLVVISIIALLSSVLLAATNVARAKGRDAKKQSEMASVQTAINAYFSDKGVMPPMYNCPSTCTQTTITSPRTTFEFEDTSSPGNPTTEAGRAYKATMEDLVSGGYITGIPQSPGGTGYFYFDYGRGSAQGALFGTTLEASQDSTTGAGGSCRPNYYSFLSGYPYIPEDPTRASHYCPSPSNPTANPAGAWQQCTPGQPTYAACQPAYFVGSWYAVCPTGNYYIPPAPRNYCAYNLSNSDYCQCNTY